MKVWGKIRCKYLFSSESASEAVTPVVGSLLMLLILVVLAGAVASSIINSFGSDASFQPPVAMITLESCEGGLYGVGPTAERAKLEENRIVLVHEGGDSLPLDAISIRVSGYGNSYQGDVGEGGTPLEGDTDVLYHNLGPEEKNGTYMARNNEVLKDGFWSTGEKLILCGQDSSTSTDSTVKVSVNGDSNTSDNYGFKAGSEITLMVIDIKNRLLSEQTAIVKQAD